MRLDRPGLTIGLIFLLGGCTPSPPVAPPAAGLRVQLAGEPVTLDPALAEDGLSMKVLANTMEGLVGYDGAGKLQPRLAESYQVSPDGKRYEFTLRPGLKWSDGKPLQAEDFVQGLRRSLSPQTGSKHAELLFPIRGAEAYHSGKSRELSGVHEEAGRLVIELERPTPYFVQLLTLTVAVPERADVLQANAQAWPTGPAIAQAPVSGPYRITSYESDRKLTLEANPQYWAGQPKLPKLELLIVRDESTAMNLFDNGKLDIVTRVPSLDFKRLQSQGVLKRDPYRATYYLAFNCRKPPFNDRDWRRAVSAVIQKKEIAAAVETGEMPARSWVPPGLEGHIPFTEPLPDRSQAIAKVRAAAAQLKKPVEAVFDSSSRNALVMEKVQQDVLRGLGLRLTLNNLDWKTHIKTLQTDPAPIYRFGWLALFQDPISHLQVFTTGNPNNYTGCAVPRYDALVDRIERLAPGPEREKLIREAQRVLVDDEAVVVPIYHYVQLHAVAPTVKGFRVNPFGVIRFDELELK